MYDAISTCQHGAVPTDMMLTLEPTQQFIQFLSHFVRDESLDQKSSDLIDSFRDDERIKRRFRKVQSQ